MHLQPGQTVLITGATGGLGCPITHALAGRGVKLALVAFPGVELENLRLDLQKRGIGSIALASDLRDAAQRREIVERVRREYGEIDLLINNAGIEFTAPYDALSEQNIRDVLAVNLEAPMMMTRLVLPGMLARRRGHIINVSSLAGKAGPALQEPYAATKAALIAFTQSLRATYRGSGVSASVIVPGFVEAGIYAKLKQNSGCSAPPLLGSMPPQKVVDAVFRALEGDLPEVLINSLPVRPLLAFVQLCPSLGEWLIEKTGGHEFFRRVYAAIRKDPA